MRRKARGFFLPLFAERADGIIRSASLITLDGVQAYLKIAYFAVVFLLSVMGVFTFALQNCHAAFWLKSKATISLTLGVIAVLVFMVSSQPYAAIFAFALLIIKVFLHAKRA